MPTKIVAHRGDQEHCPENTMVSFQSAVNKGAEAIELDIHLSQDGKLVVHHDYYLGSTDNGEGLISNTDAHYLKSLDAGSWFSRKFASERIPLLEEVFEAFRKQVRYEIELKGHSLPFLEATLKLVRHYDVLHQIEFTSPHAYILSRLKEIEPAVKTGCFIQAYPSWMTTDLGEAIIIGNTLLGHINVVHCPFSLLSPEFVRNLQRNHVEVHAANCDAENEIRQVLSLRVNQLSTNKLDLALQINKEKPAGVPAG